MSPYEMMVLDDVVSEDPPGTQEKLREITESSFFETVVTGSPREGVETWEMRHKETGEVFGVGCSITPTKPLLFSELLDPSIWLPQPVFRQEESP